MAGARGCDSGLDRRVRFIAVADAREEIAHGGDGAVFNGALLHRGLVETSSLSEDREASAVELQGALGSAEYQSTIVDGRNHRAVVDHLETGIAEAGLNCV